METMEGWNLWLHWVSEIRFGSKCNTGWGLKHVVLFHTDKFRDQASSGSHMGSSESKIRIQMLCWNIQWTQRQRDNLATRASQPAACGQSSLLFKLPIVHKLPTWLICLVTQVCAIQSPQWREDGQGLGLRAVTEPSLRKTKTGWGLQLLQDWWYL